MNKVRIVAEVGSNWDPSAPFDSCHAFVDAVAEAGADHVKFQDWHPLEEFDRPYEWKDQSERWTLEPDLVRELRSYAVLRRGLGFITSVFTHGAVLRARYHDIVKIASSEIGNQDLLITIAQECKGAVWLSLGEVPNNEWVNTAIARLGTHKVRLLACVAEYPVARPLDLWDSYTFAQQWALPLGVSSHIAYPHCRAMIKQLVGRGADAVEVHVRLQGVTPDDAPDNGAWALWLPEFKELVKMIRSIDARDPHSEAWD